MSQGIFIAFEGLDGSGKSTQAELLAEKLNKEKGEVFEVDFPQYGNKSAGPLEKYLNGEYGGEDDVRPEVASIFFACDRYDGSFKLKEELSKGSILIADRYTASNAGHQGGKITDKEKRREFIKWLYKLEYEIFEIPRPDISFILKTTPELAFKKSKEKKKEKKKKVISAVGEEAKDGDIHERSLNHLERALDSYLFLAEEHPDEYFVIESVDDDGRLLPPEKIHQKIIKKVNKIL